MNTNNITKQLYMNIYRSLGGDPNTVFDSPDEIWNAIENIYDEGYDPIELSPLDITISENGSYIYTATDNDGYNSVNVNVEVAGSGSSLQWSLLGYNSEEQMVADTFTNDDILKTYNYVQQFGGVIPDGVNFQYIEIMYAPTSAYIQPRSDYSNMFDGCWNLKYVPSLDCSSAMFASSMFANCGSLTEVGTIDLSNCTTANGLFAQCQNLTYAPRVLLKKDTSDGVTIAGMFEYCMNLQHVDYIETSRVFDMSRLFFACHNLQALPAFPDCGWCTTVEDMLGTDMATPFSITEIGGFQSLGWNEACNRLDLHNCPNLSETAIYNVVDTIANRAEIGNSRGSLIFNNIFEGNIAEDVLTLANTKGWDISYQEIGF